jgi:hypothetical protein
VEIFFVDRMKWGGAGGGVVGLHFVFIYCLYKYMCQLKKSSESSIKINAIARGSSIEQMQRGI